MASRPNESTSGAFDINREGLLPIAGIPDYLASHGIRYPIYTVSEEAVTQVFPRGEVLIPISFLVDERLAVLDIFTGWSAESRRAVHALAADQRSGG